jgi:hypothetical protein
LSIPVSEIGEERGWIGKVDITRFASGFHHARAQENAEPAELIVSHSLSVLLEVLDRLSNNFFLFRSGGPRTLQASYNCIDISSLKILRRLRNLKPWPNGVSGNPKGRPKSQTLGEAYRKVLAEPDPNDPEGRTFAELIAAKVCNSALSGDIKAAQEIADRTEVKGERFLEHSVPTAADILELKRERLTRATQKFLDEGMGRRRRILLLSSPPRLERGTLARSRRGPCDSRHNRSRGRRR